LIKNANRSEDNKMDSRQVFRDTDVKAEFLERWDELAAHLPGGLEGLDGMPLGQATEVVESMAEGTYTPGTESGLEAIIERFTRPVYFVRRSTFTVPNDNFPNSELIHAQLDKARQLVDTRLPSAGRIDLRNHRLDWVGTGWMVADGIVVTNRHVAQEFASPRDGGGFAFRQNFGKPAVAASVDWRHEHGQPEESRFGVVGVLHIEPDDSVDVALLRVKSHGDNDEPCPEPIPLMTRAEFAAADVGAWIAVIGYPAQDSRNNAADQQRIFDGVYNVKRLAPGQLTSVQADTDTMHHDATTLGGNSGSVILDLATGKAIGLHYGGLEGEQNEAVQAPRVHEVLAPFLH
jgi:S1-C subfamily serine protease